MRINTEQSTSLFHVQALNNSLRRNLSQEEQQKAGIRTDQVTLSPQGKSSSLLASLMNQKELIQMNKDSLIKRELGEDGVKTGNFSKQLEEYERQLEDLDEQIAREMAKQAQGDEEENTIYKNPREADAEKSVDECMMELSTEDSVSVEKKQTLEDAREKREREKSTVKAEAGNTVSAEGGAHGSPASEHKLNGIAQKERWAALIESMLEDDEDN